LSDDAVEPEQFAKVFCQIVIHWNLCLTAMTITDPFTITAAMMISHTFEPVDSLGAQGATVDLPRTARAVA